MIYGKIECRVPSDHGRVYLTVCAPVCSIKQNGDLVRLTMRELRELATDALAALDELENGQGKPGRGAG